MEHFYLPKTYEDGRKNGYNQGKKELHNNAKLVFEKMTKYLDEQCNNIKNNLVVDKLFNQKTKIVGNLELFGDMYILRSFFDTEYKKVCLMTDYDSNMIDERVNALNESISTSYQVLKQNPNEIIWNQHLDNTIYSALHY